MQSSQEYIVQNIDSFELNHIFDCGQCFRRNQQADWSYTWVFWNNVLNIQKNSDSIIFSWMVNGNIQSTVNKYFDLDRDYNQIKTELSKVDNYMKESIKYWHWIRLLNQNLRETIISFIISANNNIPRIKWIIERLSQNYWTEIDWNWQVHHTFPTAEQLKDVSISDYRKLWLWFRDERVYTTTRMVLDWKIDLNSLYSKPTEIVREKLLNLSWIWPKVADCILLFSDLKRLEVFQDDLLLNAIELLLSIPTNLINYIYVQNNIINISILKNLYKNSPKESFEIMPD